MKKVICFALVFLFSIGTSLAQLKMEIFSYSITKRANCSLKNGNIVFKSTCQKATSGGLSTVGIVDGAGRIFMNSMRIVAYSTGNSSVGKALPSNLGGMAGKIYDGAILNKGFFGSGLAQNVLGVSNDAAGFILGGGSKMATMLYPATNFQIYRAASSYGLYY